MLQSHLNTLYRIFREEIVVLIERLRFLYLENLCNVTQIVDNKKEWGEDRNELKDLHKMIKNNMKGDYNPKSSDNATIIENLIDNKL